MLRSTATIQQEQSFILNYNCTTRVNAPTIEKIGQNFQNLLHSKPECTWTIHDIPVSLFFIYIFSSLHFTAYLKSIQPTIEFTRLESHRKRPYLAKIQRLTPVRDTFYEYSFPALSPSSYLKARKNVNVENSWFFDQIPRVRY